MVRAHNMFAQTHSISAIIFLVVATVVRGQVCQSLLQTGSHAQRLLTSPRLRIITVTGIPVAERASAMLKVVKPTLTHADSIVHICDPGCDSALNGSLGDIREMPDAVFPGGKCTICLRTPKHIADAQQNPKKWKNASNIGCSTQAYECTGLIKAQMKFVWGLINEVQVAMASQEQMPSWWMLKDDDTYVNADAVMTALSANDPDDLVWAGTPGQVHFSDLPPYPMHGGYGQFFSRGLAKKLATEYADMWKNTEMHGILNDETYLYDMVMKDVIYSIPNVTVDQYNDGVINNTAHGEYCLKDLRKGHALEPRCKQAMPYAHYCLQHAGVC